MLKEIIAGITSIDRSAYTACADRFDSVAKPVGSLGKPEALLARIAGITGSDDIDIRKKCVLTFCADNGVVEEGVAENTADVTTAVVKIMAAGKSCVCVMAKSCGAEVFTVDVGMRDTVAGLINRKQASGTRNIARGPAMSRETAIRAMEIGAELVAEKKSEGFCVIGVGEVGIGNTTTAAAVAAALLGKPAAMLTGRGAGLSDEGLARKIKVIERAIAINNPDPDDPIDIISKVGGLDIAAMAGAFLGGAAHKVPMVIDGVISAAAALSAVRLNSPVRDYLIPSHLSAEPAGSFLMEALELQPIIRADMRLGEGAGAVALFPILDMAAAVYNNAATYTDSGLRQ